MPHNRGTRHKPKYVGLVSYKGRTKWVGTCSSIAEYRAAEQQRLAVLREEVDNLDKQKIPTVLEFAEATIHVDGRVTMVWPDGQRCEKAEGRKPSSVARLRDGLRQFVREHGDRPLDSFTRTEALTWIRPRGTNVQQAVRQFFNHAADHDLIAVNKFARVGASKHKRRVDRHDFEIISDEQYARLRACARASRTDDYGLVIEGAILAIGEAAIRPGEVFALHCDEVDYTENLVHVRFQIDTMTGKRVSPKDDDGRWVVMSPALREHLERMPRSYSATIDPIEDGGLGLDPATVAEMVGHDDGGWLISTVYTKFAQRRALARAQRAIDAYRGRLAATPPQGHPLQ